MANNETYTCSPSEVCLSDSDSELLIPTPWSDESKNEKRAKRWREEFEWKRSLFEIDFTFGINAFDLDKGTDVMKDTVSLKNVCEEEKKRIKHCKRWYWNDPELENKWYRTQLYEMHLLLNPSQREELENELTSREELAVLQVEFADMEGQIQ
ncbi:hypothetical protein Tco_1069348 [Tanacetum coccineum]|uniref:Uncharacterized protein n=1 Tax=Tanacetum coccineum TaxID=301880 RepID=A0ABQ5HID6_9ASTR